MYRAEDHNEVEEGSGAVVGKREDVHSHKHSVAVDIDRREPEFDDYRHQDRAHRKGLDQDKGLRVAFAPPVQLREHFGLIAEQECFEHVVQSWSVGEVFCVSLRSLPV